MSSSPHRTLNSSRGIIRYRDDDQDELTDDENCYELAPQGITHAKRFLSKRNGKEIKLNTFLLTFSSPAIPRSIRMGLYNAKVSPYVPNPVRCYRCQTFGHGKGQCKGKVKCFKCGEEDNEGFDCTNDLMCCNCGQPRMASSKDCHFFNTERDTKSKVREKYNVL